MEVDIELDFMNETSKNLMKIFDLSYLLKLNDNYMLCSIEKKIFDTLSSLHRWLDKKKYIERCYSMADKLKFR